MKALLFALAALVSGAASATAQIPDTLVVDGEPQPLFAEPLGPYLRAPERHARIKPYLRLGCSGNWRGYVARWEIREDWLLLTEVREGGCDMDAPTIPLERLFPGQLPPIHAAWFSGTLRVPQGRQLEYVHMGYGSRYERELLIEIDRGRVVSRRVVENAASPGK